MSTGGGAPSTGPRPLDLNVETLALRLEPMLGSNPTVSDIHIILYSLFNTFCRLSGGTPLSPPQPPCDRFPYGFASPMDVCARGLRRMLTLPPPFTSSSMTRSKAMALALATSWHLATVYPRSVLWWTPWDSHRW